MGILAVAIGGASGAVIRFLISQKVWGPLLPWPTLLVNVLGSFLLGCFIQVLPESYRPLVISGFCGGLTTYSTFALELHTMINHGQVLKVAIYVAASVLLGILAVSAGVWLGRVFG